MADTAHTTFRFVPPSSRLIDIVDDLDQARSLVVVASMAIEDFDQDPRRDALSVLLNVIEGKLKALSSDIAPNGVIRA